MVPTSLGRWERTAETKERKEDGWKDAIRDREWRIIGGIICRNLFSEKVAEREYWFAEPVWDFFFFCQTKSPVFLLPPAHFCQFLLTVWCSHDASSHMVYLPRAFQTNQANNKEEIHHIIQNSCQCPFCPREAEIIYIIIMSYYYYPDFHLRVGGLHAL